MLSYILKRLAMAVPTVLLVTGIVFVVMRVLPGDPAAMLVRDVQNQALIEAIRVQHGLDEPLPLQYVNWLMHIARLDFGRSILTDQPVLETLLERFAVTAQVALLAVFFTALIAIAAGTYAAWRQNSASDLWILSMATVGMSLPAFWTGILLILVFGVHLGWLPTIGFVSPFEDLSTGLKYLIMPAVALTIAESGALLRMVRSTTIEVLRLDYITNARAKGLSERRVLLTHALRNTLAPTLTMIGLLLGALLGGAATIETVFTLPGVGHLLVQSIFARDYPMVQGILIAIAFIYILLNLIVDLLYPLLDRRVRL